MSKDSDFKELKEAWKTVVSAVKDELEELVDIFVEPFKKD